MRAEERPQDSQMERNAHLEDLGTNASHLQVNLLAGLHPEDEEDVGQSQDAFGTTQISQQTRTRTALIAQAFQDTTIVLRHLFDVFSTVLGCTLSDDKSARWIDRMFILVAVFAVASGTMAGIYRKQPVEDHNASNAQDKVGEQAIATLKSGDGTLVISIEVEGGEEQDEDTTPDDVNNSHRSITILLVWAAIAYTLLR